MRLTVSPLIVLLAVLFPALSAAQVAEAPPKADSQDKPSEIDLRFSSPRATVRTFLNAITQAEDTPSKIEEAEECLDLSGVSNETENGGNLAVQLEAVLRSLGMITDLMPDKHAPRLYVFADQPDQYIALERTRDGRWRFDGRTVQMIPKMRNALTRGTLKGATVGRAQGSSPPVDIPSQFGSPRATFRTFLTSIHDHNMSEAASCFDLSEISPPARQSLGQALAVKLREVVDRYALVLYQDLPDSYDGDSFAWMTVEQGRVEIARQVAGHRKGQWLFTKDTVRQIEPLYDFYKKKPVVREAAEFEDHTLFAEFWTSPGLWVRSRIPDVLERGFSFSPSVRIEIYQVVGLVLMLLMAVAAERTVARLSMALIVRVFAFRSLELDSEAAIDRLRPVGWMAALAASQFGVALLDLRRDVAGLVLSALNLCFWIMTAYAFYRLIDLVADYARQRGVATGRHSAMTEMLLPVLSLLLRVTVIVVGLMIVLQLFELDVAAVLTGLGIGGLAFALAAQDTLKNFFGSFTLIADRTFFVGDLVKIGANEGTVESVGVRSTRIRTPDDSLLTIPNSELTTAHITNYGSRRFRRNKFEIGVKYSTPIDRLLAFQEGILELVKNHPHSRHQGEEVAVHELSEIAIKLVVNIQFLVKDWHSELEAKQTLVVGILKLADQLGIELAVPIQTVQFEAHEPRTATSLSPVLDQEKPARALSVPHGPHPSRFVRAHDPEQRFLEKE